MALYSSARRMSSPSMIGMPSSDTATIPAPCISPISASSSPLQPFRDRADRVDAGEIGERGALADILGDRGVVVHRIGVRHAGDRREAAGRRGARPGLDRLLVFVSRLAQMHVHVDEAGKNQAAAGVDARSSCALPAVRLGHGGDAAVRLSAGRGGRRRRWPDRSSVPPRMCSCPVTRPSAASAPPARARLQPGLRHRPRLSALARLTSR